MVTVASGSIEHRTAVAAARVKFLVAWGLLLFLKAAFAASMPLFGDEAFYAWSSLHPAWAYSDLPGATAALVAIGTALGGDTVFGVRLAFLALGALLPWLVVRIARRIGGEGDAWQAGLWSLPIPLLLPMGVMALPDVLLTVSALLALDALLGLLMPQQGGAVAADRGASRAAAGLHLQLALGLAMGALAHYRMAPLLLVGALAFLASGDRRPLRQPGLWVALAIGVLAWWPVVHFNLGADAAGLRFQFVERHPWAFHAQGLAQPLLQAIITTPLLYGLLLWALLRGARASLDPASDRPRRFLAIAGLGLWVLYAAMAPFVDRARFSLHWPLPAYLVAAALLPVALRDAAARAWPRRLAPWALGFAAAATMSMAALFAIPASPVLAARTAGTPLYPDNFVGWREMANALRPRLDPRDVVVADHFMLAAQLSFELGRRREVFVLDHWNNHKHGRAAQIALWGYDEAGIAGIAAGTRAWIAFEVAETPEADRAAWVSRLCRWFDAIEPVAAVDGPGGGKRFWLYRATARGAEAGVDCRVPPPS